MSNVLRGCDRETSRELHRVSNQQYIHLSIALPLRECPLLTRPPLRRFVVVTRVGIMALLHNNVNLDLDVSCVLGRLLSRRHTARIRRQVNSSGVVIGATALSARIVVRERLGKAATESLQTVRRPFPAGSTLNLRIIPWFEEGRLGHVGVRVDCSASGVFAIGASARIVVGDD